MYEGMKDLIEIDWRSFLLSLSIFFTALYLIKTGIEKFCSSFCIETPWMKNSREKKEFAENIKQLYEELSEKEKKLENRHANDIEQLKELDSHICNSILELTKEFSEFRQQIETNELRKNIKKLRWDIIEFASTIFDKKEISIEQYNIIFDRIKEYEELVDKYHLTNGQVTSSVGVIRERYEQDLRNGLLK